MYTMVKSVHMVLKGVKWIHNGKIRSYGLERSQLGTQSKYPVQWSSKESNDVHNVKIRSNGLERSQ